MPKSLIHLLLVLTIHFIYIIQVQGCFIVHYVMYFDDIPMKYYLQISQNSSFPYLVHLNQRLNLPNNKTLTRPISPAQMSDIKKVQVIYHHGGLYLDNDQFINYQCIRQKICHLTGLYFLDWTDIKDRWKISVPLSFIYSSHPLNDTLRQSIQGLNQSIQANEKGPRTVFFSGPSHMQEYRDGMQFIKIPKSCQFHRADRSWVSGKQQNQIKYQKSIENKILKSYTNQQKESKEKFTQLWLTQTVIYPLGFDLKILSYVEEQFNHVQMVDKIYCKIRVIKYSKEQQNRKKLESFIKKYEGNLEQDNNQQQKIEIKIQEGDRKQEYKTKIINKKQIITQIDDHRKITEKEPITQKDKGNQEKSNLSMNFILIFFSTFTYQKILFLVILTIGCGFILYRKTRCCHNNNYEKQQQTKNKGKKVYETQYQLQEQQQQPNSVKIFQTSYQAISPNSHQKQDLQNEQSEENKQQDEDQKGDTEIEYQLDKSPQNSSEKQIDK